MLGLDSNSVVERIRADGRSLRVPTLPQSVITGAVGFTAVSLLMFAVWALAGRWMYAHLGAPLFYGLLGVGFMGGGGCVFAPLLIGKNLGRFYILFVASFFLYAMVWMVCWFKLGSPGEWLATLVGPLLMAGLFVWAFGARTQLKRVGLIMVTGHTLGYFIGEWLFYWEPLNNPWGMMIWGLTYGMGLGGAIASALFWCQAETRDRLLAVMAPAEMASDASVG